MPEVTNAASGEDLSVTLSRQFPGIPLQSVVQCVLDAQAAVEYAAVDADDRAGLIERLAQAHLEELAPFYVDGADTVS